MITATIFLINVLLAGGICTITHSPNRTELTVKAEPHPHFLDWDLQWNIRKVTPDWILASYKAAKLLPVEDFPPAQCDGAFI